MGPLGKYDVPASVDYNLWAGPAPMEIPLTRPHFHYDWHWIWNYGNGELGNNSVHVVDLMRKINHSRGAAFIFSTHDPEVLKYAKNVVKIKDGILVSN